MSRRSGASVASADAMLIRALAREGPSAIGPFLDRHLPRVYGLLRMTLSSAEEVEAALGDVFCAAISQATDPLALADPEAWLAGIALQQVERRAHPRPPTSLEQRRLAADRKRSDAGEARSAEGALTAESFAGVSDEALAVLIRTLDLHSRQALVLGVVCGLPDGRVASAIGCERWEVERLKSKAMEGLMGKIAEHQRREAQLKREIAAVPYKLRPLPVGGAGRGPAGSTVVVGHRVHLEPDQSRSLAEVIRRALKRLAELFRRHRGDHNPDDEAGDSGSQRSPQPTPSLQPFERPASTPTTRGYRSPKLSPGVAVYTMPRGTPTTRRLSNPRRPPRR